MNRARLISGRMSRVAWDFAGREMTYDRMKVASTMILPCGGDLAVLKGSNLPISFINSP